MTLHIFIPDSLLEETTDPKIRTYKVGQIARAAAIFGVEHIWIYKAGGKDGKFIKLILEYAETPQYLRKALFPIMKELKYVGVIPPLRTPHHKLKGKPKVGEIREGVIIKKGKRLYADIGLDELALVEGSGEGRMTFKIVSVKPLKVIPVKPVEYWGYRVHLTNKTLAKTLKKAKLNLAIATSRKGEDVRKVKLPPLEGEIGFVFGSPRKGVMEILRDFNEDYPFDLILNTIPNQKTKTVRTEEAVLATLAVFNFIRRD
ncbi:methylase [Thermococcus sp. M39]|uniref:putative RNA uridine N3 methyltransferase n=1 Tax=unclassified Thermococcus TaxID=2627626 RepID=UPI00143B770B|nr:MULTISPECIES: putative RNA uridine N3 methyltransferase [unclassified Thermococcus]NJE07192.1 methylase [Thermococcus sp. M39]NJE12676.1 methylase [Thermococcus sp. LS2]